MRSSERRLRDHAPTYRRHAKQPCYDPVKKLPWINRAVLDIAAWESLKRETDHESHQSIATNRKAVRRPVWKKGKLTRPKPRQIATGASHASSSAARLGDVQSCDRQ